MSSGKNSNFTPYQVSPTQTLLVTGSFLTLDTIGLHFGVYTPWPYIVYGPLPGEKMKLVTWAHIVMVVIHAVCV